MWIYWGGKGKEKAEREGIDALDQVRGKGILQLNYLRQFN